MGSQSLAAATSATRPLGAPRLQVLLEGGACFEFAIDEPSEMPLRALLRRLERASALAALVDEGTSAAARVHRIECYAEGRNGQALTQSLRMLGEYGGTFPQVFEVLCSYLDAEDAQRRLAFGDVAASNAD